MLINVHVMLYYLAMPRQCKGASSRLTCFKFLLGAYVSIRSYLHALSATLTRFTTCVHTSYVKYLFYSVTRNYSDKVEMTWMSQMKMSICHCHVFLLQQKIIWTLKWPKFALISDSGTIMTFRMICHDDRSYRSSQCTMTINGEFNLLRKFCVNQFKNPTT